MNNDFFPPFTDQAYWHAILLYYPDLICDFEEIRDLCPIRDSNSRPKLIFFLIQSKIFFEHLEKKNILLEICQKQFGYNNINPSYPFLKANSKSHSKFIEAFKEIVQQATPEQHLLDVMGNFNLINLRPEICCFEKDRDFFLLYPTYHWHCIQVHDWARTVYFSYKNTTNVNLIKVYVNFPHHLTATHILRGDFCSV